MVLAGFVAAQMVDDVYKFKRQKKILVCYTISRVSVYEVLLLLRWLCVLPMLICIVKCYSG